MPAAYAVAGSGQWIDAAGVRQPGGEVHAWTPGRNETVCGLSLRRSALRPFPLALKVPMPYYPTATDKVRFVGEPVAVVVAGDRYLAEDAAELVEIDYEPLPPVVDVEKAGTPLRCWSPR